MPGAPRTALGWVLAEIYDVIPNYGIAIIVLTLADPAGPAPLGIKQIRSMQHMQAMQPKIKELQKKYKSNKQKQQEETMKLYKEAGVNPLGGCLPLLLQFPILIAMYSVLRAPIPQPLRPRWPAGVPGRRGPGPHPLPTVDAVSTSHASAPNDRTSCS